jgi:hypothetical protein
MFWGLLEANNFSDLYSLEILQLKNSFFLFLFWVSIFLILPQKSDATVVVHSK